MEARRLRALSAAPAALVMLALAVWPRASVAQSAAAGNVTIKLTIPAGVTKMKGVLTFTARGLASGWASSAPFQDLAKRAELGIAVVAGGDDLNDGSYPGRCKSGEFNNIPMAFDKLATMTNHPELAHAPLVGLGHSHGGDYWNWFNACHPDRMAMVFVHASGGVNYTAGALKTPVFYTLGTSDLIENGSKKPRAGMFVNRFKGAPMTMVIGEGGHDTQFGAAEYQIVTALIEAIFKMRVPADADPAKGPVLLNDIVEGPTTWVGDLYTKEIATYADFKGDKGLTAFLPNEALAMMWKGNGPGLPTSVTWPKDTCSWCGKPNDEPAAVPGGHPPPPVDTADAGAPVEPDDAAAPPPESDAAPVTPPPAQADASAGVAKDAKAPPVKTPKPDAAAPMTGDDNGDETPAETARSSGGCSLSPGAQAGGAATAACLALVLGLVLGRVRRRR
jgi:hypothetical protein